MKTQTSVCFRFGGDVHPCFESSFVPIVGSEVEYEFECSEEDASSEGIPRDGSVYYASKVRGTVEKVVHLLSSLGGGQSYIVHVHLTEVTRE